MIFQSNLPANILNTRTVSSGPDTVTASDQFVEYDAAGGAISVTLPSPATMPGKVLYLRKDGGVNFNIVTFTPSAGTIDNGATDTLNSPFEEVTYVAQGSNWKIIGRRMWGQWVGYTAVIGAFGTISSFNIRYRRAGPNIQIRGVWVSGTGGGSLATIGLPSGLTTATFVPGLQQCGTVGLHANGAYTGYWALVNGSVNVINMGVPSNGTAFGSSPLSAQNGSVFANSSTYTISCEVPIQGWNG